MYQLEWNDPTAWKAEKTPSPVQPGPSGLKKRHIYSVMALKWEAHCVECGYPECYSICSLYKKRPDRHCSRLSYGIVPNKQFKGLYAFGADLKFLKWGKIEAKLLNCFATPFLSYGMQRTLTKYPLLRKYANKLTKLLWGNNLSHFDSFIIECYSPNEDAFKLMLEYFLQDQAGRKTLTRNVFIIRPGYNYYQVPFSEFKMTKIIGYVYLYPENNLPEKRLIFTWLDFVKFKKRYRETVLKRKKDGDSKIKCVAWDLDNTIWNGVLADSDNVQLREDAKALIKELDDRGILQTIVSKNDEGMALDKLRQFDIEKYFLYPAINWGQKSENLRKISERLNLDLGAFAFIDDSSFERAEVANAFPQVRVYSDREVCLLGEYEEFIVPVSEEGRKRRLSYIIENERQSLKDSFSGNYLEFLASCKMTLTLFVPSERSEIKRCWELVQRSNQLNLSTRRYTENEFDALLSNKRYLNIAMHCRDRFGDYGIVGFSSINMNGGQLKVEDFVLSCRVAQKKVEHFYFISLMDLFAKKAYAHLSALFILTPRNKILGNVFTDLNFDLVYSDQNTREYKLSFANKIQMEKIMEVEIGNEIDQSVYPAFTLR